jgi:hypothetical protein
MHLNLGQSAANLQILEKSPGLFVVRKSDFNNSVRLEKQFRKFSSASEFMKPLCVPILKSEFIDSGYEMEIIEGKTLGEFIQSSSIMEVDKIAEIICSYLARNLLTANLGNHEEVLKGLIEKCQELTIGLPIDLSEYSKSLFSNLLQYTKNTFLNSAHIKGWNHGDFSLENILVASSNDDCLVLYVIDFLDSPAETPMLDLGRLFLDLDFGWWGGGHWPTASQEINTRHLSLKIKEEIGSLKIQQSLVDAFVGFSIFRILPYTKNPIRLSFLKFAAGEILRRNACQLY